jgi:hypothetical protein
MLALLLTWLGSISASNWRFRSAHQTTLMPPKKQLISGQYCVAAKDDRYWYRVVAGIDIWVGIRPGSSFTAEMHAQIAGIDPR